MCKGNVDDKCSKRLRVSSEGDLFVNSNNESLVGEARKTSQHLQNKAISQDDDELITISYARV